MDIRESYNNHKRFKDVYERYKDKISIRGFQNVWWFNTWKHICPEYNTKENKEWQKHQAKANPPEVARNNKRAFTPEQVRQMRNDFDNGMTPKQDQQKYAPEKRYCTIYNIVNRITYKDIDEFCIDYPELDWEYCDYWYVMGNGKHIDDLTNLSEEIVSAHSNMGLHGFCCIWSHWS